jgi:hypothetical protein
MRKSGWRLALAAVLFASWIGYLAYLAATTTEPLVLSRPQFLSADLYVIAEVSANPAAPDEPAAAVTVKRVVWLANPEDGKLKQIVVKDLNRVGPQQNWQGPGEYILALSRTKEDAGIFQLTPLPRTPGFYGDPLGRIYKTTPETLRQLELLKEQYHP